MRIGSRLRHVTLALLAAPVVAAAQAAAPRHGPPPGSPPAFPASPVGRAASALIELLRHGDTVAAAGYVATWLPRGMGVGMTPDRVRAMVAALVRQSGGLEVQRIAPRPDGSLRVYGRARAADRRVGLELIPAPGDTTLRHLGIHPMEPESPPWVDGPVAAERALAIVAERVERAAKEDRFAGTVLVARGDRVLYHQAFGFADREDGRPNRLETAHPLASMGKMFAAAGIALLARRGVLRFEDTLARVLPEYPDRAAASRITLHHLLTHTAGLGDPFDSPAWTPGAARARQADWFPLFAHRPPAFEPGARFEYSNGGYAVLGAVIERVTGQRYWDWIREQVFRPAGMDAAGAVPQCATGYLRPPETDPLGVGPWVPNTSRMGAPRGAGSGMGGGCLSALDLFRFARAIRTGTLLGPALTERLVSGKVPLRPNAPVRYGYGFFDMPLRGIAVRGHSGGGEGSGMDGDLQLLWEPDWTVVVVGNYDTPAARSLSGRIVDVLSRVEPAGR